MNRVENPTPRSGANRPRLLAGLGLSTAVLAVVALTLGLLASACGTDRTDAGAVGEDFAAAIAAHDADACELATPVLAAQLHSSGRCTDTGGGGDGKVRVLFSTPCATRGLLGAQITPELEPGKPYALIGLALGEEGEWSAASLRPMADRNAVRGGICTTSTGGGD